MPFCVLKHWHPMVGVDYHIPWPPGAPAPAPSPVPYNTFYLLNGLGLQCSKADDHLSDSFGLSMLKGTDIGMMIPHVGAPSVTLPVEMLTSGSKSHWGTSRYVSKGKPVACALMVTVNPNLNCGTPVPTPTGFVMAITTHMVDMSIADIVAGLVSMAIDAAIQAALNAAGSGLGKLAGRGLARLLGPSIAANAALRAASAVTEEGFARYAQVFTQYGTSRVVEGTAAVVGGVIGFVVGGPMGLDSGTLGLWGTDANGDPNPAPAGGLSDWANNRGQQAARGAASPLDGPEAAQPPQALPGSPGTGL